MLSPASLRVCCLAVMAPALTKADRRADCLPVVLSEPFCVSKTVSSYNRKDKSSDIHLPKLPSKFSCLLNNRRKAYIHKTWFRTHLRNNSPEYCFKAQCPTTDLHNGKPNAESQTEAWHGTSVTLAVADKVRLKYTMNKNSNSLKNMGLARTNASLSLHSMKKVNRITQFSPRDKTNPSTPDVGESSPDLPDSTNSELETALTITRIVSPPLSQSTGDVSSSSGDSILSTTLTHLSSEGEVTLPVTCASPAASAASENCSIMPISISNDIKSLSTKDLNVSVSVTLIDPECTQENASLATPEVPLQDLASAGQLSSPQDLHALSCHVPALNVVHNPNASSKTSLQLCDAAYSANKSIESSFENLPRSAVEISKDFNYALCNFESDDFLALTHSSSQKMGAGEFSVSKPGQIPSSSLKSKGKMRKRKICCQFIPERRTELEKIYNEQEVKVLAAIERTEMLFRMWINCHSQKEIESLVDYYRNKLAIPCQRQLRSHMKPVKDIVDLKAELLQSEDVKSLSTAALVNLVRKLESSNSPGNLLPQQNSPSVGNELSPTDPAAMAFAPEDIADVMHTGQELLTEIKRELECVDPDLTESSEESGSDMENTENESAHKKTLCKFMKQRAALTCRSTWLIARIHELENQLRTAIGALQKVSSTLGDILFEEPLAASATLSTAGFGDVSSVSKQPKVKNLNRPVNGYLEHSPMHNIAHIGQDSDEAFNLNKEQIKSFEFCQPCSRTRALNASAFRKRDVLVTTGLHLTNNKFAKLSNLGCHCCCQDEILPCVLCMGRYHCVQSVDPDSMPLLDRVSLLDSNFHPLLSFNKDVPLILHFENILKKNEGQYEVVRPVSPTPSHKRFNFGTKPKHFSDARSRSRKLNRYARTLLSAKYRNKQIRNTKHLRKRLLFGKWRRFRNKSSLQARDRIRRISIDSSGSSHDSPVPSPGSVFEDGGDNSRRRRDDNQFDIDDVIIPYSNKSVRLVEFEFKDIIVPSFRIDGSEIQNTFIQDSSDVAVKEYIQNEECVTDVAYLARHDPLEVDEKKINRRPSALNLVPIPKRPRREHRLDSRADSSGANTPDPVLFCDQDMFQDHSSMTAPTPPALSPPTTPSSANLVSDDSQPSFGSTLAARIEKKRVASLKRPAEDQITRPSVDTEEVAPYDLRSFPLSDEYFEEIAADPYGEDIELTVSGPSSPASPGSTTLSTSTIEDVTDPEWMVLKNNPAQESGLKLKLAKR